MSGIPQTWLWLWPLYMFMVGAWERPSISLKLNKLIWKHGSRAEWGGAASLARGNCTVSFGCSHPPCFNHSKRKRWVKKAARWESKCLCCGRNLKGCRAQPPRLGLLAVWELSRYCAASVWKRFRGASPLMELSLQSLTAALFNFLSSEQNVLPIKPRCGPWFSLVLRPHCRAGTLLPGSRECHPLLRGCRWLIGATKTGKEGWRERRMSHQISVCSVIQSCLTLCDPIDRSPPGLSMGFPRQEYTSSSRGSPCPRYWTCISCTAGRFFTHWDIREAQEGWALWLIRERPRGLNKSRPALQLQPAACFLWEIKAMQCKLAISRKARNSVCYFFLMRNLLNFTYWQLTQKILKHCVKASDTPDCGPVVLIFG